MLIADVVAGLSIAAVMMIVLHTFMVSGDGFSSLAPRRGERPGWHKFGMELTEKLEALLWPTLQRSDASRDEAADFVLIGR